MGEACSHIAAVLSCIVKSVEAQEQSGVESCTSKACYWLPAARKV